MPDLPADNNESVGGDSNDITNQSQKSSSAPQVNNLTRDSQSRLIRVRRQSMEQLDLIKVLISLHFLFVYSRALVRSFFF